MRGLDIEIKRIVNEELERFASSLGLIYGPMSGTIGGVLDPKFLPYWLNDLAESDSELREIVNTLLDYLELRYLGRKPTIQPKRVRPSGRPKKKEEAK